MVLPMAAAQRLWQSGTGGVAGGREGDDFLKGGYQLDLAGGHDGAVIISQWRAGRHERRTLVALSPDRFFAPEQKTEIGEKE